MKYYLYILLCDQKIFYIGITDNLIRRLSQHKKKQSPYTKKFSKICLVYSEYFDSRFSAEKREKQIKKWSIAKKKALVSGNMHLLKELSKNHEPVE